MKLPAYSRYDWLLQIIVLPIFIGIYNWLLIGNNYWQSFTTFALATGISLLIGFVNWYINNYLNIKVRARYPNPDHYARRTWTGFILASANSCLIYSLPYILYRLIDLPGFVPSAFQLGLALLFTLFIVAVVTAVYESIHNFEDWQQSRRETDTLTRAQMQTQLDALRQQVNPHFLFNSLNSLISLIEDDPKQAGVFAEELSTVYRHLLRNNELPLTTLSGELDFLHSYCHLLKTRYGNAFVLVTQVPPAAENRQLPPLTLQLLIENAVKHNVILPEQPLLVSLIATEHELVVSNTIQRKAGRVLSNGVGLSNILSKYQMLGQGMPRIEDDGQVFSVMLPLV